MVWAVLLTDPHVFIIMCKSKSGTLNFAFICKSQKILSFNKVYILYEFPKKKVFMEFI